MRRKDFQCYGLVAIAALFALSLMVEPASGQASISLTENPNSTVTLTWSGFESFQFDFGGTNEAGSGTLTYTPGNSSYANFEGIFASSAAGTGSPNGLGMNCVTSACSGVNLLDPSDEIDNITGDTVWAATNASIPGTPSGCDLTPGCGRIIGQFEPDVSVGSTEGTLSGSPLNISTNLNLPQGLTFTAQAGTPEPAALSLVTGGMVAMWFIRRRSGC